MITRSVTLRVVLVRGRCRLRRLPWFSVSRKAPVSTYGAPVLRVSPTVPRFSDVGSEKALCHTQRGERPPRSGGRPRDRLRTCLEDPEDSSYPSLPFRLRGLPTYNPPRVRVPPSGPGRGFADVTGGLTTHSGLDTEVFGPSRHRDRRLRRRVFVLGLLREGRVEEQPEHPTRVTPETPDSSRRTVRFDFVRRAVLPPPRSGVVSPVPVRGFGTSRRTEPDLCRVALGSKPLTLSPGYCGHKTPGHRPKIGSVVPRRR